MNGSEFLIPCADRVANLPPYVFATVFRMKEEALAAGREVIDLGVGNPDGRAPANIIAALNRTLLDDSWNCHGYGTFKGLLQLREAIASWYLDRFGVTLDPDSEILPLIGSKEGLANLMRAYLNAGDTVIIPSPCYPAYFGAARLCEAEIYEPALAEDQGFVLDFDTIDAEVADRARMLIINYPNNPTGGVCDLAFYEKAVTWCRDHRVLLVSDIAYSELGFSGGENPSSVFQVDGAREVAVEFQSLSKSHNMAGWRAGFAVGGQEVIANLGRVKSNVDFSLFGGIQMAAVEALSGSQQVCADNRTLYEHRRDLMVEGYRELGWNVPSPPATLYIWARIPPAWGDDDFAFITEVFEKSGVLLSPGSGFGIHGRGYARTSLVINDARIGRVMELLKGADLTWG
ncbi:MAG: aminotransferase class I/II-fold pyridoxal phosphate-dependent enzyme [Candidatus Krumholzibacteria bacterium]|nr:aminotransferase class I/II-fold pyridoxal phosphate-dependent enzyme [Candidatus Krumholzibacteria bacterium]